MRSLKVIGALLLVPVTLAGQEPLVAAGTRVRLTTKALEKLEGTVTEWRGDTLVLRPKKGLLTSVPMGEVNDLLVVRGRRPDPWGGAVKGMMVGVILSKGWKSSILPKNLAAAAGRMADDGSYRTLAMMGMERSCA